jgi:TetR/AcrR family transcriptional regulator, cholesterol catabolism regulator
VRDTSAKGRFGILQPKISPGASNSAMESGGRRERNRARMRERLLSAALELFAAKGFADTTIDQIAERADVARQTVLNHFPHKTDFARAWGQGRRDELAAIGEAAAGDESTRSLLHRYFAALAEANERERDLTRAMLQSLTPTEIFLYIRALPAGAIERGQARGELRTSADPSAAAEVLSSVYFGTVSRWLIDGPPPFDLASALAERLELVLAGLLTR